MSGLNINGREHSLRVYQEDVSEELWKDLCTMLGKKPSDYNWLILNFDSSDVDDMEDAFDLDCDMKVGDIVYVKINNDELEVEIVDFIFEPDENQVYAECRPHWENGVDITRHFPMDKLYRK